MALPRNRSFILATVLCLAVGCGGAANTPATAAPPPPTLATAAPTALEAVASSASAAPARAVPEAPALPTPQRSLLALSKADHTLAIVDPATLKVVARVPVGPDPHEVIASTDGKTAFVSNTGGGRFHELDVIDLVAQRPLPAVDTGALTGPHGLAFSGGRVWFSAEGAKSIGRYDPAAARVDWIMGTGQNRTHMVYVTADEKQLYATNVDSGTVSILEYVTLPPMAPPPGVAPLGAGPRMDWVQTVIPVAKGNEGFDVSPDRKELWTAAAADGSVSVIDLPTRKLVATIAAKVFGANRLKFTPDGKRVMVSSVRTGDLVIFDAGSRRESKRLHLGHGAAGILMDADGGRAFVGCTADDYVAVVDLKTLAVTGHVDVGGKPDGLAWAVRP
jgi:DNA-binding beta-propeller fold protein YncE